MKLKWLKIVKRYYEWLILSEPWDMKMSLKLDNIIHQIEEEEGKDEKE